MLTTTHLSVLGFHDHVVLVVFFGFCQGRAEDEFLLQMQMLDLLSLDPSSLWGPCLLDPSSSWDSFLGAWAEEKFLWQKQMVLTMADLLSIGLLVCFIVYKRTVSSICISATILLL
jgi:hypothetical protein